MQSADLRSYGVGRLVDIEETAQVHAVRPQIGNVEQRVLDRLKLERQAVLNPVRLLVVFGKARDCGGPKEAGSQRIRWIRIIARNQAIERLCHSRGARAEWGRNERCETE